MFITALRVARSFGAKVWTVAVLEIVFGVGMLVSGLLVSTVLAKGSRIGVILIATIGYGLVTAGLGLSPNLWVFYALRFGFGVLNPLFSAPFMTLIQETVDPDNRGRVFGYLHIAMATAAPIGLLAFGPLADVGSGESLLVAAGIATIVVTGIAVLVPSDRAAIAASRARHRSASEAHDDVHRDPGVAHEGSGAGPIA